MEERLRQAREYHSSGRNDEAVSICRRVLEEAPDHADALRLLGMIRCELGDFSTACEHLQRAVGLLPDDPGVRCQLGDALQSLGKLGPAVEAYRSALALDGELAWAWYSIGCAQAKLREYASALACFERALRSEPDHYGAHQNFGQSLFELGHIDLAIEEFRKAQSRGDPHLPLTSIAVVIPSSPRADNRSILAARKEWAERCLPPAPPRGWSASARRQQEHPRRVGYLSSFFQSPNWMKPVWGLLNHHDRTRFEIHLFSDAPVSDLSTGYEHQPEDRLHDISKLSGDAVARLIEGCEIDILVDLNAFSAARRLPVVALHPAPVVCAWFNLFATSGMKSVDYLIGDEHVIPAAEERYYTESILRVPGCYLAFDVRYPVPDVVEPPCLSAGAITFGCLAPQYKITLQVVEAWSRILRGSPRSRIILRNTALAPSNNRSFVHALFDRHDIPSERVELKGPADHFEFLKTYAEIDIALDTFPYNGGTTTMEALWQGVPVLTFCGDRWASRTSTTIIRAAGLGQHVARDLESHVRQAIAMAGSPETPRELAGLRRSMRERLRRSAACDTARFAMDMEALYEEMWQRWRGVS